MGNQLLFRGVYGSGMLDELLVWPCVLVIISPIAAPALAWARTNPFYRTRQVQQRQRRAYVLALILASISAIGYVGYWGWWTANLYHVLIPIRLVLLLEVVIRAGVVFSAAAIVCMFIGPGP